MKTTTKKLDTIKDLGNLVIQFRKDNDLTLADLAKKSGCSISGLSLLERGINIPGHSILEGISKATKIPYDIMRDLYERVQVDRARRR